MTLKQSSAVHIQALYSAGEISKGRPDFHSNTINHIKDYLQLDKKLNDALDVACGTGLSTKALLEIATNVYGTDNSQEMLNFASQSDKIHYSIASAEQQPFKDSSRLVPCLAASGRQAILFSFAIIRKFRSFNKQQRRANSAISGTGSQTAAMHGR